MLMKTRSLVSLIASFLLGAVLTFGLLKFNSATFPEEEEEEQIQPDLQLGQIEFINPLLECTNYPSGTSPKQAALQEKIQRIIESHTADKTVEKVSVYFRDLNNGPTFGINGDFPFIGASLLKVPLLIGYVQKTSLKPELLNEKIVYDPKLHLIENRNQTIAPQRKLKPGEAYSVRELMERMITESDNSAANMLILKFPDIDILRILKEMGVTLSIENDDAWLSVKNYSAIFRILYNATYLNREQSNSALKLLSDSVFKSGLQAGLPAEIKVAHKFGERQLNDTKQFHDCGIVYFPKRPYLLCVMTRGNESEKLAPVIAEISKTVYEAISSL